MVALKQRARKAGQVCTEHEFHSGQTEYETQVFNGARRDSNDQGAL